MRGRPGVKCYGSSVDCLRKHARSLGHDPAHGRSRYAEYYQCKCTICGATIAMRRSRVRDGYRMLPLGECPEPNNFCYGWGI